MDCAGKKALITGATSYPGLCLAAELMRRRAEVHVIARSTTDTGKFSVLPAKPVVHIHDGAGQSLADVVGEAAPDITFHLAGRYVREHSAADIDEQISSNIVFGAWLLEALGDGARLVNTGTYFQHFDVEGYRPVNLYAAAKQAFKDLMDYYTDSGRLNGLTLTLFDTYGPGDWRPRLMAALRDAQESGEALPLPTDDLLLHMVYIDDVSEAFLRAWELLEESPGIVNGAEYAVRLDEAVPISAIADAFEAAGGKPLPRNVGAFAKAERAIAKPWNGPLLPGWRARVPLVEGIRRFLEE